MADTDPANPNPGTTIGDVAGDINHALIAGRDIIGNLLVTGDHNQVFAGGYERLADAYIKPHEVFDRVHLEHFTGREWLLAAVDAFLQDHDCGYFILEADAGLGKTTFLAWLVKQRNYVHHFSELAPGPEGVEAALKSLAAQLALAYELKPEGVLPAAASRPDYLYDLLGQAAQQRLPGEKVVLVVDALDQAGTPLNQNVLGLPTSLPAGVCVIVSQRPVPVTLQIKASHTPRVHYLLTAESDGNQSDMRRFLERAGAWPGIAQVIQANNYTPEQFVASLLAKSRGLWIYLHYVVAQLELDAKGKGARHLDLRLDRLPDGLTQYYIHYWQGWRNRDEDRWYNLYLPLLATLAAAQEAATLDRLLAWAGMMAAPPGLARLFSELWRPFLIKIGQGQSARYRFYHATLPEFFAGHSDQTALTTAEQSLVAELAEATRAAHDRLAARYLQAWAGLEAGLLGLQDANQRDLDERYGLRYLPYHLAAAGRSDDLHRLLRVEWPRVSKDLRSTEGQSAVDQCTRGRSHGHESGYQNAWYTVLESLGQTNSYLSAVTTAWRSAETQAVEQIRLAAFDQLAETVAQPNAIALQYRYALIFTSLNNLANNILPGLLQELVKKGVWLPQQALAYARRVPDLLQRTEALAAVARHFDAEEQKQLLQAALHITQRIVDSDLRTTALATLAPYLSAEQLQEALHTVQGIEDSHNRASALVKLAPYLSTARLQEALHIAQGIEANQDRASALAELAPYLSPNEQEHVLQEALRSAQGIEHFYYRAQSLAGLVSCMAELGQLQEALHTAQGIEYTSYRASALTELAPYLTAAHLQEALRIAQGIENVSYRAQPLARLVSRMAELGHLRQALHTAYGIEDSYYRASALVEVAPYLIAGEEEQVLQEALRTARCIKNNQHRATSLAKLVPYLVTGEGEQVLQEALCVSRGINDSQHRADSLTKLAPYLVAGEREQVLQEALRDAQTIRDTHDRAQFITGLISHIAELGHLQEALNAAQAIEDSHHRASVLAELAPYLSTVQLQDVLQTVQAIEDIDCRARTLAELAPRLSTAQLQEALHTAQSIEDSYLRAVVLADLTPHLIAGEKEQVLEYALWTARGIKDSQDRADSLAILASYLVAGEQGQVLQEALCTAQGIKNSQRRARSLAELVSRMAVLGHLQEALHTAQCIGDSNHRAQSLVDLAAHFFAGEREQVLHEALRTAQSIEDRNVRASALAGLASHMLELGYQQEALHTAQAIEESHGRVIALAKLIPHLLVDEREQVLQEALRTAQGIETSYARASALANLAPYLSLVQMQETLRLSQRFEDSDDRAVVLADLVPRMVELGYLQEALYTAHSVEDSHDRGRVLSRLVPRMADLGYLQEALNTAQRIENRSYRVQSLTGLVSRMAELGHVQEALHTAQGIEEPTHRATALTDLAPYLSASQLQEVLPTIQCIEHSYHRSQALIGIASRMVELGQLQEALHLHQDIDHSYDPARALAVLAQYFVQLSSDGIHSAYCGMLSILASRTRSELLWALSALASAISRLGGSFAVAETAQAIQDVGRWWP